MSEVVGIGALNVNYVLAFSEAKARLNQFSRAHFKSGQENWAEEAEVNDAIAQVGYAHFDYCGLGGAAYHAIDCLAQLGLGLSLGYIGVAGIEVPSTCGTPLDVRQRIRDRGVDDTFVFQGHGPPGRTVSSRNESERSRSNITTPGANKELKQFLSEPGTRENIIKYLAAARWVHLSSLVDRVCMIEIAEIVTLAKQRNTSLIVSFDPGSEYCRCPEDKGTNTVQQVLRCADYLFINDVEFYQLAKQHGVAGGKLDSTEVAGKVFQLVGHRHLCIVVQATNYYRVQLFWKINNEVLTRREFQRPFIHAKVKEVTGASGILAAGFVAARLLPDVGYDSQLATRFAMALVRAKLGQAGFEAGSDYHRILNHTRKRLRRKDRSNRFFAMFQPLNEDFVKGVLASLAAAVICAVVAASWRKISAIRQGQPAAAAQLQAPGTSLINTVGTNQIHTAVTTEAQPPETSLVSPASAAQDKTAPGGPPPAGTK